jgi:hypothetical protein
MAHVFECENIRKQAFFISFVTWDSKRKEYGLIFLIIP